MKSVICVQTESFFKKDIQTKDIRAFIPYPDGCEIELAGGKKVKTLNKFDVRVRLNRAGLRISGVQLKTCYTASTIESIQTKLRGS